MFEEPDQRTGDIENCCHVEKLWLRRSHRSGPVKARSGDQLVIVGEGFQGLSERLFRFTEVRAEGEDDVCHAADDKPNPRFRAVRAFALLSPF